jgi:hypothetical protein
LPKECTRNLEGIPLNAAKSLINKFYEDDWFLIDILLKSFRRNIYEN